MVKMYWLHMYSLLLIVLRAQKRVGLFERRRGRGGGGGGLNRGFPVVILIDTCS